MAPLSSSHRFQKILEKFLEATTALNQPFLVHGLIGETMDKSQLLNVVVLGTNMARNIEIKARIDTLEAMAQKVAAIATEGPIEIAQDDTFFWCQSGRLKLRVFTGDSGELIFYRRANQHGPKESFYLRSPTSAPDALRESLSLAYGQVGRIRKQRTLFLVGRARVHLDRVEGLGDFLEIEVVLIDGEPPEVGVREVQELMEKFGIKRSQLIKCAYIDLLAQQGF